MSLHRKLLLINMALVAGLAAVGGALLWGLWGLHRTIDETSAEYEELRIVETAMLHASAARIALLSGADGEVSPLGEVEEARAALRAFEEFQSAERDERPEHHARELTDAGAAMATIEGAADRLAAGDRAAALTLVENAIDQLEALVADTDVSAAVADAHAQMNRTTLMAAIAAGAMILVAVLSSTAVHRAVMRPLRRLRAGVRTLASGRFDERVAVDADPEFAALAEDFNQMATELEGLYRDLEAKVAVKSRELAQSERLASVGYLAAGVAHEINNPLGIVSGYAELCRRWLADAGAAPSQRALADARHAATVIADEAQRCKEITGKLLSMARMGDGPRDLVSLTRIAHDMVGMMGSLMRQRRVHLALSCDPEPETWVMVNATEIRQVVLNLLVNALEAVSRVPVDVSRAETWRGRIDLAVRRVGGQIELAVEDNGCGMSAEVLERVFEPFFTAREHVEDGASPRRGVGLGLSISHAIAEGHGGSLRASSPGLGKGSRFVLTLPAASLEQRSSHAA